MIKTEKLKFKSLTKRTKTSNIVLHHRAGNGDLKSIHNQHLNQGWAGVGYHFYIRKNGEIWQGRPQDAVGSHCPNFNSISVGICFEGNFETEKMQDTQLNSGIWLIKKLKKDYLNATIKGHKELYATACPGKNFPLGKLKIA